MSAQRPAGVIACSVVSVFFSSRAGRYLRVRRQRVGLALLLLLTHCGGKAVLDESAGSAAAGSTTRTGQGGTGAIASAGTSTVTSSAGTAAIAGAAGRSEGGASSFAGTGGIAPSGGVSGESGGVSGGVTSGGSGGLESGACLTDADCTQGTPPCLAGWCSSGECEFKVDQKNLPSSANPCLVGTCNLNGMQGTNPVPVGTRCMTADGGAFCDGGGDCVQCLKSSDCAAGFSCAANKCTSSPCTGVGCDQCQDQQQDGNETGIDCGGGICPGCAVGQPCFLDVDCAYPACDSLTMKCIISQCADHRVDGNESDVDCGGTVCQACGPGRKCRTGIDCPSGHLCVPGTPSVCN